MNRNGVDSMSLRSAAVLWSAAIAICSVASGCSEAGGVTGAPANQPVRTAQLTTAHQHPSRPATSGPVEPSTQPPSTQPPATEPPATQPPITESPITRAPSQLPNGGTTILPRYRLVAFYGGPGGPGLGVLGAGSPQHAAAAIERTAAAYRGYGRPVQPAMELIATVAQSSPGPAGTYSAAISNSAIRSYLDAAHAHHMLLILDIQPGSGEFLPEVKALHRFLLDPSVSIALDPEWKVPPGQAPGNGRIGSASAASINAVGAYLSHVVQANKLPDKLLVIHQFALSMLPDRDDITQHMGLEMVLHADGESSPAEKIAVYGQLHFPHPPFYVGFKVFFTQDTRLMSPAEVMALRPRPNMITYQ